MQKKIYIKNKKLKTSILIKKNYISNFIKSIAKKNEKVFCVIDSKIKINLNLSNQKNIIIISFQCGENIKTYDGYKILSEKLILKDINRKSAVIAIGGGTLGDLTGFVASTLLRGLDFFLIPTTLLSQVDSSIGGKNGINTTFGKNLLGTFYQPKEVLIDISILNSLPKKEIRSGYAEIIKHALIKDYSFFYWLEKNANKLLNLNQSILEQAIYKSIMIKLFYVKKDEREFLSNNNSRAMLNFGHTIGHAIENYYDYQKFNHGEAISIGMITEAKISNYLGLLSSKELEKIIIHFKKCKLKIYDKILSNRKLIKILTKDKKNFQDNINFSLIDKIGSSIFYKKLDKNQVYKILKNI
ncbi:3-dehydroquinate synthase [Pelagibacteraceae bacterium]|nr:3-dehydroquinate synthase [Pelagibacteraceae bacterium]